jgi:hypothetical protein
MLDRSCYTKSMDKKKRKPTDINLIASSIVEHITKQSTGDILHQKNPAAVALGRLGGLKGGKARAEKLSAKRRKAIAKKAAQARWGKIK